MYVRYIYTYELPRWLSDKESPAFQAGDLGSLGWGRSLGDGNGNPLQYSCLGNPMGRGAWWAAVVSQKSWTRLSDYKTTTNICL